MNQEACYGAMSDYFAEHTPQLGEHVVTLPHRQIEVSDLDDIFAGRPLAEHPRAKANIPLKTYVTDDFNTLVEQQAEREHIGKAALIRKALTTYLAQPQMA